MPAMIFSFVSMVSFFTKLRQMQMICYPKINDGVNGGPPAAGTGFTCCFLSYLLLLHKLVQCLLPEPARIAAGGLLGAVLFYSKV